MRRGETLVSVARAEGLSPAALLKFNFGTTDPRQINWYLANYVGCSRTTPDRRNYLFDDGLFIWLPAGRVTMPQNVETEILVDLGFKGEATDKIVGYIATGVDVAGAALTVAGMVVKSVAVANLSIAASLVGAAMVPIASLAQIAAIRERGPRSMAAVAQAYTKTAWVYGDRDVPAPLPRRFLERRFPELTVLEPSHRIRASQARERDAYEKSWTAGADAMADLLAQGFRTTYQEYRRKARSNGHTTHPESEVLRVVRELEKLRYEARNRRTYLNALWKEMRARENIAGIPGTLPTDPQQFDWDLTVSK